MLNKKNILKSAAITAMLLGASCAEKEVIPQFTPDPQAFEFAIKQAIQAQLYIEKCPQMENSLTPLAKEAEAYWNANNLAQVQIADQHYSKKLAGQTHEYNNKKISLPAISLLTGYEKNISALLDDNRQSLSSIIAQCRFQLTSIKSGKYDVGVNKNANLYLKSLSVDPSIARATAFPSLAGDVRQYIAPGSAHYSAGKILRHSNCNQEETITLRKDEVFEEYAATCSNGRDVLVTCDLGQCEARYLK